MDGLLRVILLANWGLGLEALKILHVLEFVEVLRVVTGYDHESDDPWRNCVYDYASRCGYPVSHEAELGPADLRRLIIDGGVDLLVSHAYMRLLPESVFSAPRFGGLNIHPSLLPRHRGPSPTAWVLKNKETETGLTCHYLDAGIDTGDIVAQITVPVEPGDTLEAVIDKQKRALWSVLPQALGRVLDPGFTARPQDERRATYEPRPES